MRLTLILTIILVVLAPAGARADQEPAYVVVDVGRNVVINSRYANKKWPPASVTKIMTAYLTFKALQSGRLKLTSPVVVSKNALSEPPSKMGYKVGTVINVDNALKMVIVRSANDIAVALAEAVGGSESNFVAMMNQEARRLGMNGTRFVNPNGLPASGQYTTARDMAVLSRAAWMDFPQFREYFAISAIRVGAKVLRSHNTLLTRYKGSNGMKTGFICASGFNVVATATRRGRTLMVVVLGSPSAAERAELAASLLTRGFNGLLSGMRGQKLSSFKAQPAPGNPVNLRKQICETKRKPVKPTRSALGPKFTPMKPVRVTTGNADPVGSRATARPAPVNVPTPRPRPNYRGG